MKNVKERVGQEHAFFYLRSAIKNNNKKGTPEIELRESTLILTLTITE